MSFTPSLGSAFNNTVNRSKQISPLSGMCSFCTEECPGTCEIALSAVLGAQAVYPTTTGSNQVASEKNYPIDYSIFNINGRVFGAEGVPPVYEQAQIFNVDLGVTYGKTHPVKMALPIILPALIKLNWQDYFGGAAMAGVSCVIGEGSRSKDPDAVYQDGKITGFPFLKQILDSFRKYDRGYGQIILQCNVEDDLCGLPEYAVTAHNVEGIEFKFGQSAKGTQPAHLLRGGYEEALRKRSEGVLVHPDPSSPEIQDACRRDVCPNFYSYDRLPLWDEDYLSGRIADLRRAGLKNVYFKMAGYDSADVERVIRIAASVKADMVTFDGAGGGSGYSPCKMMNEWGQPAVMLETTVVRIAKRLKKEGLQLPALVITGGFSMEDQVYKALALGDGEIAAVGLCRSSMAAAMTGKSIGSRIRSGEIPPMFRSFGASVEEIFADIPDLRYLYGKEASEFSTGAIGVYSYLNRISFGLQHFAALNRKFRLSCVNKDDLIPLTAEARELLAGI
ncbi:glutamate synthase-related protein [Bacilliculturomica massiliensis]|uniref:glutamate synthase-related protein n=1 Tax=Bacilliculturomica massiliensis TaxID=1917867 RepID=UPI00103080BE|nr:glutamate synthase-related protein [Bacilliculturomica massiliensis]